MSDQQQSHAVLPESDHDDLARQAFARTLKRALSTKLTPGLKHVWEGRAHERFLAEHGREPADRHEIRKFMAGDPYFQYWCAVRRTSQELLFDGVTELVERQLP